MKAFSFQGSRFANSSLKRMLSGLSSSKAFSSVSIDLVILFIDFD